MKTITIIITLFSSVYLSAQNLDSLGLDSSHFLNKYEANLLNRLLEDERESIDFTHLKVAFITGNSGNIVNEKSDYFKHSVIPWIRDGERPQISMIKLTSEEKEKSGDYDVLVLSWVKVFTPRSQEKILEKLKHTN